MRDLPVVDETRCTACGDCVPVCPADCLAMAAGVPWLIRPADCISCSACMAVCPDEAISMQPISAA